MKNQTYWSSPQTRMALLTLGGAQFGTSKLQPMNKIQYKGVSKDTPGKCNKSRHLIAKPVSVKVRFKIKRIT